MYSHSAECLPPNCGSAGHRPSKQAANHTTNTQACQTHWSMRSVDLKIKTWCVLAVGGEGGDGGDGAVGAVDDEDCICLLSVLWLLPP